MFNRADGKIGLNRIKQFCVSCANRFTMVSLLAHVFLLFHCACHYAARGRLIIVLFLCRYRVILRIGQDKIEQGARDARCYPLRA